MLWENSVLMLISDLLIYAKIATILLLSSSVMYISYFMCIIVFQFQYVVIYRCQLFNIRVFCFVCSGISNE